MSLDFVNLDLRPGSTTKDSTSSLLQDWENNLNDFDNELLAMAHIAIDIRQTHSSDFFTVSPFHLHFHPFTLSPLVTFIVLTPLSAVS